MPKNDFFGTKAAANRIKAKGLQKLRWYCQVCQKQCRDENGYKNHIQSEPHQRKVSVFSEDANRHVEDFSRQFQEGFLDILKRRYATKRVYANQVYQEYISDRDHVHMNSTRWATLSEFVIQLGRAGICKIEEGERFGSWYVQWIDNSPRELARIEALSRLDRLRKDNAERDRIFIEQQIEKGKVNTQNEDAEDSLVTRELQRGDSNQKISISIGPPILGSKGSNIKRAFLDDNEEDEGVKLLNFDSNHTASKIQKVEIINEIELNDGDDGEEEEAWILPGIYVRVKNKELAVGGFHNESGKVLRVIDDYVAEVSVCKKSRTEVIRIDQAQLETVIPLPGDAVIFLKPPFRGQSATIISIDPKKHTAKIKIRNSGKEVNCSYGEISEIASSI